MRLDVGNCDVTWREGVKEKWLSKTEEWRVQS